MRFLIGASSEPPVDAARPCRGDSRRASVKRDKEETMAGELEQELRDFFGALDRMEVEPLIDRMTDDVQSVDEISRRWTRGKRDMGAYVRAVAEAVKDPRTQITDVAEQVWGDSGVVTCWIEQDYTYEGAAQHISAPTTIVFRRVDGAWKMALFHSIPVSGES
jgi:ketosteroid isomerase-like protein